MHAAGPARDRPTATGEARLTRGPLLLGKGLASGPTLALPLFKREWCRSKKGDLVGVVGRDSDSFDVLRPHYVTADANGCRSPFGQTGFTWTGTRFKAGTATKLRAAPAGFFRG